MRRTIFAAAALALYGLPVSAATPTGAPLTLEQALTRAAATSPVLAGWREAVGAGEADRLQAGLWPNPELAIASEGFAGSRELTGFDAAESTVEVTQPLPLGVPARQRAVAGSELQRLQAEAAAARAEVRAAVTADFYRALAAQRRVELTRELAGLAGQVLASVTARVDAGKAPPVEAARARVPLVEARVALAAAEQRLEGARRALASHWGALEPDFAAVAGDLDRLPAPPSPHALEQLLAATPAVAAARAEIASAEASLALERRLAWPELAATAGRKREEATGASGWTAGVAVELPLFDRNQGGIRAAEHRTALARRALEARLAALTAAAASARSEAAAAHAAARLHADEAVPAAEAAFRAVEIGYREGKLGLLEVLQAQQALFETRLGLLEALESYRVAAAELERLTTPAAVDTTGEGEDR